MVTVQRLAEYLGLEDLPEETTFLEQCLQVATDLVDTALEGAFREVPDSVRDLVTLDVAHAIYARKNSVGGGRQLATLEDAAPAMSRDPLMQSYPIFRKYVLPW